MDCLRYLCMLLIVALPLYAGAALPPPREAVLDNGLKVIVYTDTRARVVVSQMWYRVGSSYEAPGQTGISHALEHMMFKGSSKLAPGESSRILRELGAEENAFTSEDYTAFYQVLASSRLEVALEMEADRMATLALPPEEFAKEIEVIKEERRLRTDDNPSALAYERFKALAFPASGYHTPVIGWMDDIERLNVQDLRHWYQNWYAPNNATLVVAGDIWMDKLLPLVKRYFGHIPRRELPPIKKPLELAEPGERQATLYLRTELPSLLLGFNVPSLGSSDNYDDRKTVDLLRVIAALLDGSDSARLTSELVRGSELVAGAGAWYDPFKRGDSLFVLSATPNLAKGKTLEEVEEALWQQLERLKREPISEQELIRAQTKFEADRIYARDSISNQASLIGRLDASYLPWKLSDSDKPFSFCCYFKDHAEAIQQTAQRFFVRERSTTVRVLPESTRPQVEEKAHD